MTKTITAKHEMTDIKEIAKCARADIKSAIAAGKLPAFKTSVRIQRYSGGRSLHVEVTEVPEGYVIPNANHVAFALANPHTHPAFDADESVRSRDSERARADIKTLEGIVNAYNWDKSDIQSDHFHVNFYAHVQFDWQLVAEQRKAIETALQAADDLDAPISLPELPSNVIPLFG